MSNLAQAFWVELLKARRSRAPWVTALAFAIFPFIGGFFMIVIRDPELARSLGMISVKAQIVAGTVDWPAYLGFLTMATTMGGFILFGLICSWVFGREYADHTIKDLLALPTARSAIALAKFLLVILWAAGLTVLTFLIGLGVGVAIALPPASADAFWQGGLTMAVAAGMTILLILPMALAASAGHGYLASVGALILAMALSQIIIVTGYGEFFPWSVPALYTGMVGPELAQLGWFSYAGVILTGVAGVFGTLAWWELADQAR
jgi:ABC-2 type transport system permease protein